MKATQTFASRSRNRYRQTLSKPAAGKRPPFRASRHDQTIWGAKGKLGHPSRGYVLSTRTSQPRNVEPCLVALPLQCSSAQEARFARLIVTLADLAEVTHLAELYQVAAYGGRSIRRDVIHPHLGGGGRGHRHGRDHFRNNRWRRG